MKKLAIIIMTLLAAFTSCKKEEPYSWDTINGTSWTGVFPVNAADMTIGILTLKFNSDATEVKLYKGYTNSMVMNEYNYYVIRNESSSDEAAKRFIFDFYMTRDLEGGATYSCDYRGKKLILTNLKGSKDDIITLELDTY